MALAASTFGSFVACSGGVCVCLAARDDNLRRAPTGRNILSGVNRSSPEATAGANPQTGIFVAPAKVQGERRGAQNTHAPRQLLTSLPSYLIPARTCIIIIYLGAICSLSRRIRGAVGGD